jgi:hypothetical protein
VNLPLGGLQRLCQLVSFALGSLQGLPQGLCLGSGSLGSGSCPSKRPHGVLLRLLRRLQLSRQRSTALLRHCTGLKLGFGLPPCSHCVFAGCGGSFVGRLCVHLQRQLPLPGRHEFVLSLLHTRLRCLHLDRVQATGTRECPAAEARKIDAHV